MTRNMWRRISWPIVFAGLVAPFMVNCGALPKGVPGVGGLTGKCPDMAKIDEIDSFDFAGEFKLKADVAAKVKAGAGAAAEMKELAAKIDGDLTTACGNLAKDLGDTGSYTNGQDACKAAIKAIGDAKAKLGASATIKLDVSEPHCGLDISAYGDCAGGCDATVKPGSADIQCDGGKMQGSCSAQCSGDCEASAAAACSGECSGTCDADIKGSCSGTCKGKCDGKATAGEWRAMRGYLQGQVQRQRQGNLQGQVRWQLPPGRGRHLLRYVHGLVLGEDDGTEVHGHDEAAADERGVQGQVRREGERTRRMHASAHFGSHRRRR